MEGDDWKICDLEIAGEKVQAQRREFKSGKKGYGFYGKINVNGKLCQVICNIVELRS